MFKLAPKERQFSFTCSAREQKITSNWSVHIAHSIHYSDTKIYITSESFIILRKKPRTHQTRFTLWDAEMPRFTVPVPCMILLQTASMLIPWSSTSRTASEKAAIPNWSASQTIPVRTSVKPWTFSAHREWRATVTASFMKTNHFLNFLGPHQRKTMFKISRKPLSENFIPVPRGGIKEFWSFSTC